MSEAMAAVEKAVRFGIKINKNEEDSNKRVTYLYDAVGMIPAVMDFVEGAFNYGSWGGVEFVKNNYPCMVKFDGTEDYRLSPDNYELKEDGAKSDITDIYYAGNAMSAFKGGWLCQYETATDEYIIWSNVKYDAEYNAYHRTGKDGTLNAGFYRHIYTPSLVENVARSLSGCQTIGDMTAEQENEACKANGDKWGMSSWWEWNYIICLLKIMAKTDDLQTAYGIGNSRTGQPATTGTLNDKGQFYGTSDFRTQVKVFHTEALWGDKWERLTKLICADGIVKVLPYGEPNFTGEGYTDVYRYSCLYYSECNVKTGTCQKCDKYQNKAEAEKTDEQRYSEEQDRIDRETKAKLRQQADNEKMEHLPSDAAKQPKVHRIRLAKMFFEDVASGKKSFELRKNDRGYKQGDILELAEYTNGEVTGRIIKAEVTYMLQEYAGLAEGYCIMAIKVMGIVSETDTKGAEA